MPTLPDDLPAEAAQSLSLEDAFRNLTDQALIEAHHDCSDRLKREGRWQYVGTPRNVTGYVLGEFDTHGHRLLGETRLAVLHILEDFTAKLRAGDLTAWARVGNPLAPWRRIPASAWSTLELDDVAKGTVRGPGVSLFDVRVARTVDIVVPTEPDVLPTEADVVQTGAPGRPSSMHLVEIEFGRRRDAGELAPSLAKEAAALEEWFRAEHPEKPRLTAKTIANRLRDSYRQAKTPET